MAKQDWLTEMPKEAREELFECLDGSFYVEECLNAFWTFTKERGLWGQDWYVEFTSDYEGYITGAYLAYSVTTTMLNVTLPLWGAQVEAATETKGKKARARAFYNLIESVATEMRPFIDAMEAAL